MKTLLAKRIRAMGDHKPRETSRPPHMLRRGILVFVSIFLLVIGMLPVGPFQLLGSLLPITPAHAQGSNLIQNGCFDSGLTNWSVAGTTSAEYIQSGGHGSCSHNLAETLAGSSFDVSVFQNLSGLSSGTYRASAWIESGPTAITAQPGEKSQLTFYDQPGGTILCKAPIPANATTIWTQISCWATITHGTATIAFETAALGASGQVSLISDVSLTSIGGASSLSPGIVTAPLTTNEAVVADAVVTKAPFNADNTGGQDATGAFQDALNDVWAAGGGVVFVPDGTYQIDGTLTVPMGVTLRGDWIAPGPGAQAGTILEAYSGQGSATGTPFITLQAAATVRNLSIWYPRQNYTAATINAYPYTIQSVDNGTNVENVTLFDSYQGISFGANCPAPPQPTQNCATAITIQGLYATCLLNCVTLDGDLDYSFIRNDVIANSIWQNAPSVVTTKPGSADMAGLAGYTTTHLVGILLQRADDTTLYGVSIANALKGVSMQENTLGNWYGSLHHVTQPIDYQVTVNQYSQGYTDTDLIPQAVDQSYSIPTVMAPNNKTAFYNVMDYGATGNGVADDTQAIRSALAVASNGGGTVYMPAGTYYVTGTLTIPPGVELRGSFDDNHETASNGTVLEATGDAGTSNPGGDPAFITIDANAGVRGITVFYPSQSLTSTPSTYPYTFRSAGQDTWLTYDDVVDGYNVADFGTFGSSGFVIHGLWAMALNEGVVVGGGTNGGAIDEAVLDFGPTIMTNWPIDEGDLSYLQTWLKANTQAFYFDDCSNLQAFGLDSFESLDHFQIGSAGCNNSSFWATDGDTTTNATFQINDTTNSNYTFYGLKAATPYANYVGVSTSANFGGTVNIYGYMEWFGSSWTTSGPNIHYFGQQLFSEPPANNLLSNGGFESGFTDWQVGGDNNPSVISGGAVGNYSVLESPTTADCGPSNSEYCATVFQIIPNLTAGTVYTYTGYYQSSGGQTNAYATLMDQPGGTVLCQTNLNNFATSGWTPFSCTAVVPSTGQLTVTFSTIMTNTGQWIQGDDLALTAGMPAQSPSNQLGNPGFESGDLTGWQVGGDNASVVSGGAHSGNYSVKEPPTIADCGPSDSEYCATIFQIIPNLTPGARYTYTGWFQSSGGQTNAYATLMDQPGGTVLCQTNLNNFATSGWTPFSCTAVVPSTGQLTVTFSTIMTNTGQWIQGDDLALTAGMPAQSPSNQLGNPGFESGDLTGWQVGGDNASVVSGGAHSGNYSVKEPPTIADCGPSDSEYCATDRK